MSDLKWKARPASNPLILMTSDLNSLASGSAKLSTEAIGGLANGAFPNEGGGGADQGDLYADFELTVTFGVAPTAGTAITLYLVRSVDGANWEDAIDGATEVPPTNGFIGQFLVRAVTTLQRIIIPHVVIPPRDAKLFLVNLTNQAFPASGTILKAFFYREQITG